MFRKKNKQPQTTFDVSQPLQEQEVPVSLGAGELALIHHLTRLKLDECEVLYKAGDRRDDLRLTSQFCFSILEKLEIPLSPVIEHIHEHLSQES